jgi:hypothetical protein
MSESTLNLLLSAMLGFAGGMLAIPINALFSWLLKRDEQLLQHRLDVVAKRRELLLQHQLEMERKAKDDEMEKLKLAVARLERRLTDA